MKQITLTLLIGIFLLTACGGTPTATQISSIPIVEQILSTPSPLPTNTQTSLPSVTPTASITLLPTITTFTPTFDASTIVTVTHAPKAKCPTINLAIKPEEYLPSKIEVGFFNISDKIWDYLNQGGDGQLLLERLNEIYPEVDLMGGYDFRDLTGDQVPEFLYVEFQTDGKPFIFTCKNGYFEQLAILSGSRDHLTYDVKIEDLNLNRIPEIIVTGTSGASFPVSTFYIYEWNGQTFTILGQLTIAAIRKFQVKDLSDNGTKEISYSGDNPTCTSCAYYIPQRERTIILSWNGKEFVEISNEFEPPQYRFQAVQDADAAVNFAQYNKATNLYNQAIANTGLEWWSPERLTYEQTIHNPVLMFIATPSVTPTVDETEYPRLAAYAYYRIMLLHLVQNQESEATTIYNILQQGFGNDPYARPYVEMASAFWEAYQSKHKMYDGCAAAIQYAVEHPDILTPLGSDYHGSQSHIYVPADVCPFR